MLCLMLCLDLRACVVSVWVSVFVICSEGCFVLDSLFFACLYGFVPFVLSRLHVCVSFDVWLCCSRLGFWYIVVVSIAFVCSRFFCLFARFVLRALVRFVRMVIIVFACAIFCCFVCVCVFSLVIAVVYYYSCY